MEVDQDVETLLRSKIRAYTSSKASSSLVRTGATKSPEEEKAILERREADEKNRLLLASKSAVSRRLPDYCYTVKSTTQKAAFPEPATPPLSNVDARLELFSVLKKTFKVFLLTSRMDRRLAKLKERMLDSRSNLDERTVTSPPLSLLTLKLSVENGSTNLVNVSSPLDGYRIPPLCSITKPVSSKRVPFAFKLIGFSRGFPEFSLDLSEHVQTEQGALHPVASATAVPEGASRVASFARVTSAPADTDSDPTYLLAPSNDASVLTKYDMQRGGYTVKHCTARRIERSLKEHSVSMGYFDPALGRYPRATMSISKGEHDSEDDEQPSPSLSAVPARASWGAAPRGSKMSDVNSTDHMLTLNTFVNTFPV